MTPSSFALAPGVFDALTATIAENAGFDTLFVPGSAVAHARLGELDIGLLTATELAETVARIRDRVGCRLIVDADTGYGTIANLARTVRLLEAAGADVIQIEDQVPCKTAAQLRRRPVAAIDEMLDRIAVALDARRRATTLISARTDALAELGPDAAIDRAARFAERGADLIFVQSLETPDLADQAARRLGGIAPMVIHLPKDPAAAGFDFAALGAAGYAVGLMPAIAIDAAAAGVHAALRPLGRLDRGRDGAALPPETIDLQRLLDAGPVRGFRTAAPPSP